MSSFYIVNGSGITPDDAQKDAENKASAYKGTHPNAEQISIAACVLGAGLGSDPKTNLLSNIAQNLFQLVRCQCPEREVVTSIQQDGDSVVITEKLVPAGYPPPFVLLPHPISAATFYVYILLKNL